MGIAECCVVTPLYRNFYCMKENVKYVTLTYLIKLLKWKVLYHTVIGRLFKLFWKGSISFTKLTHSIEIY